MFHEPVLANDALLANIETADPGNGLVLWWLGQSTFLVKSAAGRVLLDPYLAESPLRKPASTDASLVQQTQPAIDLSRLTSIDVVVSSRNHINRMDAESLAAVFHANPKTAFVVPEASRKAVAKQLGCDPAWPWGLRDGESVSFGEITVLAVPTNHHGTDRNVARSHAGLDYVVWFGDRKVYHGGDSRYHTATVEFLRPLAIDVALLPIHNIRTARHAAGTLANDEAAQLAHDIGARLVIPYQPEILSRNTGPPPLFEDTCRRLGQTYKLLHCGERLIAMPKRNEGL